jgi:hypothetical protein
MSDYNINLVFHGVFAFVLNPDGINVLSPYVPAHDYLFGCWDAFQPMGKGEMQVVGLDGCKGCRPCPDFNSDLNPTVTGFTTVNHENVFCSIKLGVYPNQVKVFRKYDKPQNDSHGNPLGRFPFGGVHGRGLSPSALGGPIVLVYTAKKLEALQLLDDYYHMPLHFKRVFDAKTNTLNLHFFAEGIHDLPADDDDDFRYQVGIHYSDTWSRLVGTIASLDVRLDKVWPFVTGRPYPPPDPTGVTGLPPDQLLDLDEMHQLAALRAAAGPDVHVPVSRLFGGDGGGDNEGDNGGDNGGGAGGISDCGKGHVVIDNR